MENDSWNRKLCYDERKNIVWPQNCNETSPLKTLAGLFAATLMGPWVVALEANDGNGTTLRMFQHHSAARQKAFVFILQDTVTDRTTFSQLAAKTTSTDTEKQLNLIWKSSKLNHPQLAHLPYSRFSYFLSISKTKLKTEHFSGYEAYYI